MRWTELPADRYAALLRAGWRQNGRLAVDRELAAVRSSMPVTETGTDAGDGIGAERRRKTASGLANRGRRAGKRDRAASRKKSGTFAQRRRFAGDRIGSGGRRIPMRIPKRDRCARKGIGSAARRESRTTGT